MASNEQRGKEALSKLERELDSRDRKEKSRPWSVAALSAAVIALIGGGIYFAANNDSGDDLAASETTAQSEVAEEEQFDASQFEPIATTREKALPATVNCTYNQAEEKDGEGVGTPPTDGISTEGTVTVELETNQGPIGMELDRAASPCTVNAIEYLAKEGFYNDTVCHRLTTGDGLKVLQCGDRAGTGAGGPGFQFANELPTDQALEGIDLSEMGMPEGATEEDMKNTKVMMLQQNSQPQRYDRGTIAMANAGADTNGSQFFLNYGDSVLPPLYTYFGHIDDEGLSTLDTIAEAGVEGGQQDGAPAKEVRIEKAVVK
ncbi:peptidylprolyl isomerase [Corynebacterium wankanglinii]|uniref:Peptidylprolyl isomerase n=1 Tax=Corynebacterium wankanglinii TaxID=2735136 RepID=A0A838CMC9_9CORY|nr:peptidylprolyl isomerase [Corynebacterium wankanglinii]MBA1835749.1 peptidylprolyl isomerase [Corynebacterium wankanglinii]